MVKSAIRQENVMREEICFVPNHSKNVIVTARKCTHIPMTKCAFLVSLIYIIASSDSYLSLPINL